MEEYDRLYEQYKNRNDDFLIDIMRHSADYTPVAKQVATDLMKERNINVNSFVDSAPSEQTQSYTSTDADNKSNVGELIKSVAIILFVLEVIAASLYFIATKSGFLQTLLYLFFAFVFVLLIYGIGEICCLLDSINKKLSGIKK